MNQSDISCKVESCKIEACKIEDETTINNPILPLTIPWKSEELAQDPLTKILPALYNYTLIDRFLNSYYESMSYKNQVAQSLLQTNPTPTKTPILPSQNKNVRRDFDDFISPTKSLKLNTFDGEKVKLEDGFCHAESTKSCFKTPLSEASTHEGSINSSISLDVVSKKWKKEKSNQNPRKNLPGLVLQRIRATCMSYLGNKSKHLSLSDEARLKYVKDIFDKINQEEISIFREYFLTMDKNSKTWKSTTDYIYGNQIFSQIINRIIEGFLGEEGTTDFNDWLESGKMNRQTKEVIREGKEWLRQKYKEVLKSRAVSE